MSERLGNNVAIANHQKVYGNWMVTVYTNIRNYLLSACMWIIIPLLELSLASFHKFVGADLDIFGIARMGSETSQELSIKISNVDRRRVSSIKKKLPSKSPLSRQNCIFRVPITLLSGCKQDVYVPRLVSIGPFHHGKQPNLKEMEGVKLWYLQCLLNRSPTRETSLAHFYRAIGEMETDCRQCYAEEINLSGDQFVEMMVLDGCFIIELFRRFKLTREGIPTSNDDPVFSVTWKSSPLAHDLALLENQLPWKVLERLWNLTTPPEERRRDEDSLHSHALLFFREVLAVPLIQCTSYGMHQRRHLLDALRNSILGGPLDYGPLTNGDPIPCAKDLWQAGVKFGKSEPGEFQSIAFAEGEISIPPIFVHENAETLFKNVIAFEQCDPGCSINIISSYAAALCDLFRSTKDVDLLTREGIVISILNPEDTLVFFKSLSNGAVININLYGRVYDEVNSFLKKPWSIRRRRWKTYIAMLERDYFNSPWSIIKVLAATFILGFTLVQTLFAIFAYSSPAPYIHN